jgi:hypothetical protein
MNTSEPSIIGTWALVEAWDIGDDSSHPNKKTYPWGNPPAGYWVYDQSGHFSLMISQNPALPIPPDPFTSGPQSSWLSPAAPWKVPYELLIDTFGPAANPYAYFGTCTVEVDPKNPGSGTILHNVLSDVMRAYTGTVQPRPFSFDGPNFINVGNPGTTSGSYLRRLERLT